MRALAFLVIFVPAVVHADGFYVTGGGFVSDLDVDFAGIGVNDTRPTLVEVSDVRPMLFVGYGVTGRTAGERLRLFAGLEGMYMGSSKRKQGVHAIHRRASTDTAASMATGEELVETREYSVKQGETWGAGLRFGLVEGRGTGAGMLYVLGGYAQTDLKGRGVVRDAQEVITLTMPEQNVDFSGYYYGAGYEYLFTEHLGVRVDWLRFDYSREDFATDDDTVNVRSELRQSGVFVGLSGRF